MVEPDPILGSLATHGVLALLVRQDKSTEATLELECGAWRAGAGPSNCGAGPSS